MKYWNSVHVSKDRFSPALCFFLMASFLIACGGGDKSIQDEGVLFDQSEHSRINGGSVPRGADDASSKNASVEERSEGDGSQFASQAVSSYWYLQEINSHMRAYFVRYGEVPRFLSDMGIVYPDVNIPRRLEQVRFAEEGRLLLAIIDRDARYWIGIHFQLLDSYPHVHWTCRTNVEIPESMLPGCETHSREYDFLSPSFSCESASSRDELAICANDRLIDADIRLNRAYRAVLESIPQKKVQELRGQQRDWLRRRGEACTVAASYVDCLNKDIRQRTSELYIKLVDIEAASSSSSSAARKPALIELGPEVADPAQIGRFDAGWEATFRMERLEKMTVGEVAPAFIEKGGEVRYNFRLSEYAINDGIEVWRVDVLPTSQNEQPGDFWLMRFGERLDGPIEMGGRAYHLRASPDCDLCLYREVHY